MRDVCSLIWLALIGLFRSRASLQVEILTLRHQLNVLRRKSPQRLTFTSIDRLVFAGLFRLKKPGPKETVGISSNTLRNFFLAGSEIFSPLLALCLPPWKAG